MNIKKMTEEQQKLVLDNYNLIYTAIKGMHIEKNNWLDNEDLQQMALVGMCNAAAAYDPAKGIQFSTYAVRCMKNYLYDELKRFNNHSIDMESDAVPLNESFEYESTDEGPAKGISNTDCWNQMDTASTLIDLDNEIMRMENSSSKSERMQALVFKLYMAEKTAEETCKELKISLATYYRSLASAKEHLALAVGY